MHNKEQEQAIYFGTGPLLVLAGPGSGKTYVITHRIIHLISEKNIPPDKILVITFTKAAALEMQSRAISLNHSCSYVQFGTFHSVFYHILQLSDPNHKFSVASDSERIDFIKSVMESIGVSPKILMQEVENCLKEISIFKNSFSSDTSHMKYHKIFHAYENWLRENQKLDFEDMLRLCYERLKKDENLLHFWSHRFEHILIDEFQDINQLQYETIKLLSDNHNVFAVGDDDQAIYSFRGARPELMHIFEQDFGAKRICLGTNYRSNTCIVDAAGKLIAHNTLRFEKSISATKESGEGIKCFALNTKTDMYHFLQKEVHRFEENTNKSHAILTRTNGLAYAYQNILSDVKTDVTLQRDLLYYLLFINDGQKRSDFIKIMNKPVRYIPHAALTEAIVDFRKLLVNVKEEPWVRIRVSELAKQIEFMRKLDYCGQARYIFKACGYEAYYMELIDKQKSEFLYEDLQKAFRSFIEKLRECRTSSDLRRLLKTTNDKQRLDCRLKIMTYHASKGLEFDRVYLPDLLYGKVPHGRMLTRHDLEEERRMFYVAITRAKESLWLLYDKSQIESPFIGELGINVSEYYGL